MDDQKLKNEVAVFLKSNGFENEIIEVDYSKIYFQTFEAAALIAVQLGKAFTLTDEMIGGTQFNYLIEEEEEIFL